MKTSLILQQLQSKQQQLMAQIQLAQHALTLNMLLQSRGENKGERLGEKDSRDRHRSETQYSSDGSTKENQNNNNTTATLSSLPSLPSPALPAKMNGNRHSSTEEDSESSTVSLLYSGGLCRWPGCDRECSSQASWRSHMALEHGLSDKTTAQARVQMQMVTQLEVQLKMEKVSKYFLKTSKYFP